MKHALLIFIVLILGIHGIFCDKTELVQRKLKKTTIRFLGTLKQGICAEMILNKTVRAQYISSTLTGRVEPVGTFRTTTQALEYIYGLLCDIPNLPPRGESFGSVDLLQLTYDPKHYRVSAKIQLTFVSSKKLVFFTIIAFDKQLKVCGYEGVVQNSGLTFDIPSTLYAFAISNLCKEIQSTCPVGSPNQQYANMSDCISCLSEPQTPFGTNDRADQNNVVCRLIHIQLAQISPSIHCPHVGMTGGGACTDKTAQSYFTGTTDFTRCAYRFRKWNLV